MLKDIGRFGLLASTGLFTLLLQVTGARELLLSSPQRGNRFIRFLIPRFRNRFRICLRHEPSRGLAQKFSRFTLDHVFDVASALGADLSLLILNGQFFIIVITGLIGHCVLLNTVLTLLIVAQSSPLLRPCVQGRQAFQSLTLPGIQGCYG